MKEVFVCSSFEYFRIGEALKASAQTLAYFVTAPQPLQKLAITCERTNSRADISNFHPVIIIQRPDITVSDANIAIFHADIVMFHADIIISHTNIAASHADIVMFHVDIAVSQADIVRSHAYEATFHPDMRLFSGEIRTSWQ
jgi:hypothetical protein